MAPPAMFVAGSHVPSCLFHSGRSLIHSVARILRSDRSRVVD
jgi:hypothetical protein